MEKQRIDRRMVFEPDGGDASTAGLITEFERLLAMHEADLTAFVFALLPNWADTEDVLQRTRIVLWRKFAGYKTGTSFRSWALQIARFEVMNFRRTQQCDRHRFDDSLIEALVEARSSLGDELEHRRTLLDTCIRKLRPSDRQIVRHCYGPRATTTKEAAERLRRPVNTVYKALNRIRRALLECVENGLAGKQQDGK